jgi:hypothetical protein
MVDKNARYGREQQEEMKDTERTFNKDIASQEKTAAHGRGAERRKESEQENNSCQAKIKPRTADELKKVKSKDARKVATLVKSVKKDKGSSSNGNRSEPKISSEGAANELNEERIPGNEPKGTGSPWNTQQQETVIAYARARGMELQEVLQAWKRACARR